MTALVISALSAFLLAGAAWEYRKARKLRRLARAPFRSRLAAQSREIFGGPLDIRRDGEPLSEKDADLMAAYEQDFRDGNLVREPRRARRQP